MIAGAELLPVITPTKPANPANEVAKRLNGRDYISWSALRTFRTCPLKYKFRYVDGLPEDSVSSALVFGSGIHSAVEQHFQAILAGDPKPDLDALLFAYRSAWLPHDPDAIQFGSKETRETLDDLAARMLTAFLASGQARVSGRVLGVEEEIRGMLVEGVPDLFGRVDLLTEDSDSLVVIAKQMAAGPHRQIDFNGLKKLTSPPLAVALLSRYQQGPHSSLGGVAEITDDVARALVEFKEKINGLPGLTSLTSATLAAKYASQPGDLKFAKLTAIPDVVAKALATHSGKLDLSGLQSLSVEAAKAFASHEGELKLDGLKEISDEAAKTLSQAVGAVSLRNLASVSPDAVVSLKANGKISLPAKLK